MKTRPDSDAERDRILLEVDVSAARTYMPEHFTDEGILCGIHQARALLRYMPRDKRQASLDVLRSMGLTSIMGLPLPQTVEQLDSLFS